MKKFLVIILSLLMLSLNACNILGKIADLKPGESSESEQDETEPDSTDGQKEDNEDETIRNLLLFKEIEEYTATRTGASGYEKICETTASGFTLSEKDAAEYKDLARILSSSVEKTKEDEKTAFYNICNFGKTDLFDNVSADVFRGDSRVVSIYREHSFWHGDGWHLEASALNLDPKTGESIALKEVVKDFSAFSKKMEQELTDVYGENYTDRNFLKSGDYFNISGDSIVFTIGYEGLTVYFHEGTGANEWMNGTVYYDEAPEIFDGKYTAAAKNYIIPFKEGVPAEIDIDGDGKREAVYYNGIMDENYVGWKVHVNGRAVEIQDYAYNGDAYLVCRNGKYYFYVFQTSDNGYRILAAVDLATASFIENDNRNFGIPASLERYDKDFGENGSHYNRSFYVLNDPDAMILESREELLGNMSKVGTYKIGEGGYPVAVSKYFRTNGVAVVEAKKDIKCDLVDEKGEVVGEGLIEKGEIFFLCRSDFSTYADVQKAISYPFESFEGLDADGNKVTVRIMESNPGLVPEYAIFRLKLEKGEWYFKINGEEEEDIFSGIAYAG